MFRKLVNTTDDFAFTILRLILGGVFFAHGAQKALGWFGGYGFSGTNGILHQQMHIPAALAFVAICAEFLGGIGLVLGLLGASPLSHRLRHAGGRLACACSPRISLPTWTGVKKGEGYEYHLLAIAIALVIMIKGSGALSIDRALSKP